MTLNWATTDRRANVTDEAPLIVTVSDAMRHTLQMAERAAQGGAKVLITGESGVGKDLVARYVHANSERRRRSFVAVNCAGLPEELLESELFGHMKGSFTGAHRDKPGKLELAHHGTLFLDEVGEMSLRMQALLLRFLENGEIQKVGAEERQKVDVRVIAATNADLAALVAAGQFREDLVYRLRVIHLHIPALRDRREDVKELAEHFAKSAPRSMRFSEEALQALDRYRWPGNVRELQNVVEQAVWTANGHTIDVEHLPASVRSDRGILHQQERRRQLADELYQALIGGHCSFWDHIHPLFIGRDVTRHDIRELVHKGLTATRGNYRALLKLFGMTEGDYKRFLNFLSAHQFNIDFRTFRVGGPAKSHVPPRLPSSLAGLLGQHGDSVPVQDGPPLDGYRSQ